MRIISILPGYLPSRPTDSLGLLNPVLQNPWGTAHGSYPGLAHESDDDHKEDGGHEHSAGPIGTVHAAIGVLADGLQEPVDKNEEPEKSRRQVKNTEFNYMMRTRRDHIPRRDPTPRDQGDDGHSSRLGVIHNERRPPYAVSERLCAHARQVVS